MFGNKTNSINRESAASLVDMLTGVEKIRREGEEAATSGLPDLNRQDIADFKKKARKFLEREANINPCAIMSSLDYLDAALYRHVAGKQKGIFAHHQDKQDQAVAEGNDRLSID